MHAILHNTTRVYASARKTFDRLARSLLTRHSNIYSALLFVKTPARCTFTLILGKRADPCRPSYSSHPHQGPACLSARDVAPLLSLFRWSLCFRGRPLGWETKRVAQLVRCSVFDTSHNTKPPQPIWTLHAPLPCRGRNSSPYKIAAARCKRTFDRSHGFD